MRKSVVQKPMLDLLEESIALLRECPLATLALYYVGALPFVLGFLYFWTDMSRGAFARDHVTEASLELALAFVWCKCWQSIFCVHLLAAASHQPAPSWTWAKLWRLVSAQAALQPTGLIVLPIALGITLPIGYACAFYNNVSVLALDSEGQPLDIKSLRKEALTECRRWPGQNHLGLAVLIAFALVVFANVLILILTFPFLLRTFLGIETPLSRSLGHLSMFNSTLFGSAFALTYLCVDPIFKAFFTLRCFHGRSLATGQDLRVSLRSAIAPATAAAAMLLLFCCGNIAHAGLSLTSGTSSPAATVSPSLGAKSEQLDNSINRVLSKPEFAWRMPRVEKPADDDSAPNGFMQSVGHLLRRMGKALGKWFTKFGHWLGRWLIHRQQNEESQGGGSAVQWGELLRLFVWLFLIVAAVAIGIIAFKVWSRRSRVVQVIAQPQRAMPDLAAEDVTADQLAGDEWLNLAREMMERGDFRLALRAIYLAMLAHLGERQYISIARYKSNREYQRELARRRPGEADLNTTFADAVTSFERSWYGLHEVTLDILNTTRASLDRIRAC